MESACRSDKRYIDCEIIALPGEYDPKSLAFAYQLNSSYAWIFDYHINLIRENGVIDQASRKYKGPEQSCPDFRYTVHCCNSTHICNNTNRMDLNYFLVVCPSLSAIASQPSLLYWLECPWRCSCSALSSQRRRPASGRLC